MSAAVPPPPPDPGPGSTICTRVDRIDRVPAAAWDACANPPGQAYNPFAAYDFLAALEASGSVGGATGWQPAHLVLRRGGVVVGVAPYYLKAHSFGEYVFDQAWANAFMRAGGQYYPKGLAAVPFTPATGPRLLAPLAADRARLAAELAASARQLNLSSVHVTFPHRADVTTLREAGFLLREGTQYQFEDDGFGDWDGFLSALSSRRRKDLRKERAAIADSDLVIRHVTGDAITEAHLDDFWRFYQDTGSRKWGTPYLTRAFFTEVTARMAARMLFIFAERDGKRIAGALNFIGGDTLFGRYWGALEHVPFLHFELCYYQAIDFALAHGLRRVDAGAQGEHKIARGYAPVTTYSAHAISHPGFRDAVAQFLAAEKQDVEAEQAMLATFTPFKARP